MTQLDHPYRIDGRGRTGLTDVDDHVRDMIEQVLFTGPGERVNRPTFGCGLEGLVFAPSSPELAAATRLQVQAALQQWLGDIIVVESVDVSAEESELRVAVQYTVRRTQERRTSRFTRGT